MTRGQFHLFPPNIKGVTSIFKCRNSTYRMIHTWKIIPGSLFRVSYNVSTYSIFLLWHAPHTLVAQYCYSGWMLIFPLDPHVLGYTFFTFFSGLGGVTGRWGEGPSTHISLHPPKKGGRQVKVNWIFLRIKRKEKQTKALPDDTSQNFKDPSAWLEIKVFGIRSFLEHVALSVWIPVVLSPSIAPRKERKNLKTNVKSKKFVLQLSKLILFTN